MKSRRVGTFTLGLSLITFGTIFLIAVFKRDFNIIDVLKFSPIFLIILGVEILIYAFVSKEEKLKYDGVSIFLSVLIIVCSTIGSGVNIIYNTVFKQEMLERNYTRQLERQVQDVIEEKYDFLQVYATIDVYDAKELDDKYAYNDNLYSKVHIDFHDSVKSKEIFGKKILEVKEILVENNINMSEIVFEEGLEEVSGESVLMRYQSDYDYFKNSDLQIIISLVDIID